MRTVGGGGMHENVLSTHDPIERQRSFTVVGLSRVHHARVAATW